MIYCDNLSADLLTTNPVLHSKLKHFEVDLHFVRDHIAKWHVQVSHILAYA